jgi:multiple sugar transport system permease protein
MARRSFSARMERYRRKQFWRDTGRAYMYLLPAFLVLGTFIFYPFIRAFFISFYRWDFINPVKTFVGLGNYVTVFHDPLFWASVWHTVYYVLGSVLPEMALALFIAVLLNTKLRGRSFFRTAFFLPYVTPAVAATMIFYWIYDRNFGLLNYFLNHLFHIHLIDWLNNPAYAMPAVILLGIWQFLGFDVVIFLAGLQGIDKTYYEAAQVDGASAWARFRRITLPLLSPTTFFIFIISIIGSFKIFNQIYVLWTNRGGGPLHSAMTVMIYFYNTAWGEYHMGQASAVANILFVLIFVITLIQMWLSRRWVFYK